MQPVSIFVNYDEYKGKPKDSNGRTTIWGQYPSAMIIKVAEAFALKRQFGITGLVTREEMDVQMNEGTPEPHRATQQDNRPITPEHPPKAHIEPPVQPEGQVVMPSNSDVDKTRNLLQWSPEQMMANVNTWLQHHNIQPVAKWKDLDPKLKTAFYELMVDRLQKKLGAETIDQ